MNESISKLASAFESAKDLTLEAAVAASSRLGSKGMYSNTMETNQIRDLLDNKGDRSLKRAMKYLLNEISFEGLDYARQVLPDVLKNINCTEIKTRRMVYIYLLRFAELDPNTSLLSVNSIQQTLVDKNPEMRALALDVLSSMKIPALYALVLHSTKDLVKDSSFKVRSMVGKALTRLHAECAVSDDDLLPLTKSLLEDSDFRVVSSAIPLYKNIIGHSDEHLDIFHGFYRRYVQKLEFFDSTAFPNLTEILLRYTKKYVAADSKDLVLLSDNLNGAVLNSFDASTILGCAKIAHAFRSSDEQFQESFIPSAIVNSYLSASSETKEVILQSVLYLEVNSPNTFYQYRTIFALLPELDTEKITVLKIQLLSRLCNTENCVDTVKQLQACASDLLATTTVRKNAILNLASCLKVSPESSNLIMKWLLKLFKSTHQLDAKISNSIITLLRCLVFSNPEQNISTVWFLSKLLFEGDDERGNSLQYQETLPLTAETKAGIVWLVGEFVSYKFEIACEVLKKMIPKFSYEAEAVRLQIVTLSAKVLSQYMEASKDDGNDNLYFKMFDTLLTLAQYDDNYDIRDRARTYSGLLKRCGAQISLLMLQAPKKTPDIFDSTSFVSEDVQLYFSENRIKLAAETSCDTLRDAEAPVKDFQLAKMGIASSDYFTPTNQSSKFSTRNVTAFRSDSNKVSSESNYSNSTKNTYKLKSLDEFFADEPEKKTLKKKTVVVEETTSDESSAEESEESTEDESDEDSEEESEEESEESSEEQSEDHSEQEREGKEL
ncbi:hypothetical protein ACO0QE_001664 [Hanseniaspora vineae]